MADIATIVRRSDIAVSQPVFLVVVRPGATIETGGGGGGGGSTDWPDITNKPTTFPPSAHTHAIDDIDLLADALSNFQDTNERGLPNGYPSLDATGKVPTSQLPSFGLPSGDYGQIQVIGSDWSVVDGSITPEQLSPEAVNLFAAASHTHAIANITGLQGALDGKQTALGFTPQDAAQKGAAGGYAGLDGSGKVPAAQLPSYVDDVVEAANFAALPGTGETGKLYVTLDDGRVFRWSGSAYVEISGSPGSTDAVPEGATNKYFTEPRVRTTTLTGYAVAAVYSAIAAGDTVLEAFGKIGKRLADLAAVAFSGSASDLTAGTLPAARFDDTAHGARSGGTLHANVVASGAAGFMTGADKTKLDGIATGATVNATDAALRDRSTHTGTQDAATITGSKTSSFISDFAAAVAALITGKQDTLVSATNIKTVNGSSLLGSGNLVIAGGSGSPGGSSGEIQFNNAGAFAGAADVEIEGGQLRLPSIATPAAPAVGGLKLYGSDLAGAFLTPAFLGPLGTERLVQPHLGFGHLSLFEPASGTTVTNLGMIPTTVGTATAATYASGSRRARLRRIEYLVTTAATTAVAGWRSAAANYSVGGVNAWEGGFYAVMHAGPSTGVTNASHRFFCGLLGNAAAPTDVNPSTLLRMVGLGYDAADTQLQIMSNDATGAATKVALGASFPKPNADRSFTYRLELYSPPGPTQAVYYRVTYLETGAVATGVITADLPATTDFMQPYAYISVGGVSSVVGLAVGKMLFGAEFG